MTDLFSSLILRGLRLTSEYCNERVPLPLSRLIKRPGLQACAPQPTASHGKIDAFAAKGDFKQALKPVSDEITNNRFFYLFLSLAGLGVTGAVLCAGVVLTPDSASYLAHSVLRGPFVPLALGALRAVCGAFSLQAFTVLQTLFAAACALAFCAALRAVFGIAKITAALVFAALLSPFFVLHIGNTILSEAFAYGFYLCSAGAVLLLLREFSFGLLARLAVFITLGVLTRSQMAFLWGGYVFLLVYLCLRQRSPRLIPKAVGIMLAAIVFAFVLRSGYNRLYHGVFTQVGAGMHLAADTLYVSGPQDLRLFKNKPYYPVMEDIYSQMQARRLFASDRLALELPMAVHNLQHSGDIGTVTLAPVYVYAAGPVAPSDGRDGAVWLRVEDIQKDIYRTLYPLHRGDYFRLIASKLTRSISGFEAAFFLLAVLALAAAALELPAPLPDREIVFLVAFAVALNIMNVGGVSAVTYVVYRYTFYTKVLELAAALVFADRLLRGMARVK